MQLKRLMHKRMPYKKLPRNFYLQPTLHIAQQLIGKYLIRRFGDQRLIGRIVETEAYLGRRDPASHAYRGISKRNAVMFRTGGHAYVYFTYGMHFCINVVTEEEGTGHAVLLRALEPINGFELMMKHRHLTPPDQGNRRPADSDLINLCNGPAKLCQAFGIDRAQNGTDLCGSEIWLAQDAVPAEGQRKSRDSSGKGRRRKANPQENLRIRRSTRIGITSGREHRWRFYVKGSPFVSRGKPVER